MTVAARLIVLLLTSTALIALIAVSALAVRRGRIVITVRGSSMAPALGDGDVLIGRRVDPAALRAGQVVLVEKPSPLGGWHWPQREGPLARRTWMVKRLAALPGDPVPDAVAGCLPAPPPAFVPEGLLVVIGDNTEASVDSREFGFVPLRAVLGVQLRDRG
ncbi:S26 family signal peptidase [Kitasatospora sp. NBC_01250]|uniref:S26 family signal peptidase n=1 Tax=Kitasatospora sp. NBC_01250 TaxID=2903571 RepID=UPI002E322314|nr:S26 family signal peptidase [Kitasatospora sp. NBC_01250]